MTYEAYERESGTALVLVEGHCRHLTDGGTFSAGGTPGVGLIENWLEEAYYDIQAHLAENGYSVTVAASASAVLGYLERLNVYGAVMQVELAHPITGRDGEENDRYRTYRTLYNKGISLLASDALAQLGQPKDEEISAFIDVGGRSIARKDVAYQDTDAVQPRFPRHFGRDPVTSPNQNLGTP